jgi:hypothetical protein
MTTQAQETPPKVLTMNCNSYQLRIEGKSDTDWQSMIESALFQLEMRGYYRPPVKVEP